MALDSSEFLKSYIESESGMFFLKGRNEILKIRHQKYILAERKYRKALWATRLLVRLPYVRMVCIVNTLALSSARDESDIDFFIVTQKKRVWLVRLLSTFLMQVLGKRPTAHSTTDAICLSFFASENALDLSPIQLEAKSEIPDLYMCYWLATAVPVYDEKKYYEEFYEKNVWVEHFLPNRIPVIPNQRRVVHIDRVSILIKKVFEALCGTWLEDVVYRFQLRFLPRYLKESMNHDTRVIVTEDMIKFHPNDRREEIRSNFTKKMYEIFGKSE